MPCLTIYCSGTPEWWGNWGTRWPHRCCRKWGFQRSSRAWSPTVARTLPSMQRLLYHYLGKSMVVFYILRVAHIGTDPHLWSNGPLAQCSLLNPRDHSLTPPKDQLLLQQGPPSPIFRANSLRVALSLTCHFSHDCWIVLLYMLVHFHIDGQGWGATQSASAVVVLAQSSSIVYESW